MKITRKNIDLRKKFSSLYKFIRKNHFLLILFLLSTSFFIYQYSKELSWDFIVYLMNAKHYLGKIEYFEWVRPPLPSFLMILFSFFGWEFSPIIYIILTSSLFLFSSVKLARSFGFDEKLFYLISLAPYVLIYGTFIGTELLTFSLIELFIAYFKKGKEKTATIFLGLSTLVRYPNIIFLSLLIFYKNPKKILISFILVGLIWFPWLTFNYIKTGNPLASFLDSYLMNILNRNNQFSLQYQDFIIIGILFPTFILGLRKFEIKNKFHWMFLLIFALTLFSYLNTPIKVERYLFNLNLPLIFFSYLWLEKKLEKKILYIIFILSISTALFLVTSRSYGYGTKGENLKRIIEEMPSCRTQSNNWVFLNYFGFTAEPAPWKNKVEENINQGILILLFKSIPDPEYTQNQTFLSQFPLIEETNNYILLGKSDMCLEQIPVTRTYMERFEENTGIEVNECEIIMGEPLCGFFGLDQKFDISTK